VANFSDFRKFEFFGNFSQNFQIFIFILGRPSNANFETSAMLQEFVTATNIRITLIRLNTFGDELFRGTKVLQSYYYAISDFVVGGKMKCNGHGSDSLVTQSLG